MATFVIMMIILTFVVNLVKRSFHSVYLMFIGLYARQRLNRYGMLVLINIIISSFRYLFNYIDAVFV